MIPRSYRIVTAPKLADLPYSKEILISAAFTPLGKRVKWSSINVADSVRKIKYPVPRNESENHNNILEIITNRSVSALFLSLEAKK